MSKRLRFTDSQLKSIRQSPGVQQFTKEVAERVADAAGPGFVVKKGASINRPRYVVVPTTPEAYRANAKYYALIRALGKV